MKVDFDIVYNEYMKIRSNIRNKKKIFYFELLLYSNINYLVKAINNNSYCLSKFNIFYIKEKKYRLILSNNIYDKIYHHLVNDLILYKLDKYLVDCNVASRKNKGTYYGRKLLHKYLCEIKRYNNEFYILKFDIKKYFFNIDQEILINKLSKYLNNDELDIIKNIINSTNSEYINKEITLINEKNKIDLPFYQYGKGLSIGSVCSQILAIFYLNELDHYIKEKLGCKYYIRYVDDGVILMNDKNDLQKVFNYLKIVIKDYKLEFNSKTKIYKCNEGFEFLGIRYVIKNNKLIKRISKSDKKKKINNIRKTNYKFYKHYLKYVK